jgi:hypothetical protein
MKASIAHRIATARNRHVAASVTPSSSPKEQHYSPKQVAAMWAFSSKTIYRLFQDSPGLVRKPELRIPESVLQRVYREITR